MTNTMLINFDSMVFLGVNRDNISESKFHCFDHNFNENLIIFQYCFTISYKNEGQRHYDLRTDTEAECNAWIDNIKRAP